LGDILLRHYPSLKDKITRLMNVFIPLDAKAPAIYENLTSLPLVDDLIFHTQTHI
jgi:hypothetical protein